MKKHNPKNPHVFLDISVGSAKAGRMVFELFADVVPKTAENFRCLCTGDFYERNPKLYLKNSIFHRIIKGFMAQGGDTTNHNGTGGVSVYGKSFKDENFRIRHTVRGMLSMANAGPNTNGSQFFITFKEAPHLDGKHVGFGRLVSGMEVLYKMEGVPTNNSDKPLGQVTITDCGEVQLVNDEKEEKELKEKLKQEAEKEGKDGDEEKAEAKAKRETKAEFEARKREETKEEVTNAVKQGLALQMQNKKKKAEDLEEDEKNSKRKKIWGDEDEFF